MSSTEWFSIITAQATKVGLLGRRDQICDDIGDLLGHRALGGKTKKAMVLK